MPPLPCNSTFQQNFLPAVIIGIVFIIIVIGICIKCICSRRQKWSLGSSASYDDKWKRIEYLSKQDDTRPLAIIHATGLLEYALDTKGYLGAGISEKLAS